MAKAKLSDEVKTYIVQALACFDSPSVVAAAVKKEFGVDVSHDPNKKAASGLAPKWKALFGETRKTFLEDTATIAISHRAVRLPVSAAHGREGRDPGQHGGCRHR